MRLVRAGFVILGLATAMHLDWHLARPAMHHLSVGWRLHWLLALPIFTLTAWYVHRASPSRPVAASAAILGIASLLAAVLEPAWEYWVAGASFEWAFGRERLTAFGAFLATGLLTQVVVLAIVRRWITSTTARNQGAAG